MKVRSPGRFSSSCKKVLEGLFPFCGVFNSSERKQITMSEHTPNGFEWLSISTPNPSLPRDPTETAFFVQLLGISTTRLIFVGEFTRQKKILTCYVVGTLVHVAHKFLKHGPLHASHADHFVLVCFHFQFSAKTANKNCATSPISEDEENEINGQLCALQSLSLDSEERTAELDPTSRPLCNPLKVTQCTITRSPTFRSEPSLPQIILSQSLTLVGPSSRKDPTSSTCRLCTVRLC